MKVLRIFPLVALISGGLAVHGAVAQGFAGGSASRGGGNCHGGTRSGGGAVGGGVSCGKGGGGGVSFRDSGGCFRGGTTMGGNGGVVSPTRSSRGRGVAAGAQTMNARRAIPVSRGGGNNWNGGNHFRNDRFDRGRDHDHDHDHDRGIGRMTFPRNFQDFGFEADYNTPYYRGGWRQVTSPFGIPATFFPEPTGRDFFGSDRGFGGRFNGGFDGGFGGFNDGFNGFDGSNGNFITRRSSLPYFQGRVGGYRPFGTYGFRGPYTVPAGGVATAAVQSALFQRGFYQGPVDGFAGELTRTAIRQYQYQNGIPVTGRIDATLLRSIRTSAAPWSW